MKSLFALAVIALHCLTSTMGLLKKIPAIISPDLLHVLARMGHGDEIVLADANFPAGSTASAGPVYVEASGHSATALLKAIMILFPLDAYDPSPAMVMDRVERDKQNNLQVPVWDEYRCILENATQQKIELKPIERFQFYERAKKSFAVVATGETALYGNLILKKGVIAPSELV